MVLMKISIATRLRAAAGIAVASAVLAGCGGLGADDEGLGPRVVTSFYPLQYVAERVAGEHAQVSNLTTPGAEPHDLELTVRQTASIADADLLVVHSGFQPAVDEAIEQSGPDAVVDTAEVIEPVVHEDEDDPDHEHEGGDPHFWLDPTQLALAAGAVADRLAEVDPDHAADFRANLDELVTDLERLDGDYRAGLEGCDTTDVVVSHDAFGYLETYGLHFESIAGLSPDQEPSPARLGELADLIEGSSITTVFTETLASPALSETLADDLGLETAVLDPIEGLSDSTADEDYLSLMRENLAALRTANGCT
jgi:zinc transport system substrate-binding protein